MAWRTRAAAAVAGTLLFLLGLIPLTTAIAAAESYGTSISASSTELTVGQSVTLTAENLSSGTAAITICRNGWNGVAIAENGAVGVGGSIQHSVTSSTPGTTTFASFAGRAGPTCTSSADSAVSVTWVSQAAAPTTTTTTAPSVSYSVSASAADPNPNVDSEDLITASNTSSQYAYISLCQYGSASPVAEGGHSPGTSLTHDVTSSTAGDQTWYAYAGPSYGCSGAQSSVVIDWHNTATVTVDPTSAGTTSAHKNSTTISWDGAKTGDAIKVVETNHNGTAESVAKSSNALSSFSGSTTFTATETATDGTQWVNDYKAELVNSSGTILDWEGFTFTWSGTSCTGDQVGLLKASSSSLSVSTNTPPICLPAGTDSLQVYWSPTEPSPGGTIPLLTQVGNSCDLGAGPGQLLTKPQACDVTPASPHNTGWYEAYLIEDLNGSRIVVACSGHVELSVKATNVYKMDLSTSNATPVVGQTIELTAGDDSTNPEWLNLCGTTGSTDQAATYAQVNGGLTHPETSNTAGTVYYLAYASGSEKCGVGYEARVPVTWKAKPAPTAKPAPALTMTASDYNPTVGQSVTLTLTNQSSGSEWLDYCGVSGGTLVAAGLHDVGGSLTTTVSSSSPGVVTYPGWAGTSQECGTVKDSVEIDWLAATTTTTAPPAGNTGTPTGTSGSGTPTGTSGSGSPTTTTTPATTVPVSGTSGAPTTTVPPSSTGGSPTTTAPVYYPTDVQRPVSWPSGWGTGGQNALA